MEQIFLLLKRSQFASSLLKHSVVLKERNGEYAPVQMYFMYGCQEGAKQGRFPTG